MASSARRRPGQSRSSAKRDSGLFKKIEAWLRVRLRQSRYQHVFRGEVRFPANPNYPPRAVGYHHRYQGQNPPGARVRRDANGNEMITQSAPNGVYRARVDVQDHNGVWHQKNAQSSFFPDHWTPQEVDESISQAFRRRTYSNPNNPDRWAGFDDAGNRVEGYSAPSERRWRTAFPVI